MRPVLLSLAVIVFLAAGSFSGELYAAVPPSKEIPKTATVEILLLNAPGIDDEGSNWKIDYELRIANDATCFQAAKEGKFTTESTERLGELVKAASVTQPIRTATGRKVLLQIPLSPEIRQRLSYHPRDPVKVPVGKPTAKEIELMMEHERRSQNFLFYSVIVVYNAKLKKSRTIPVSFPWPFGDYPQAHFQITLEVRDEGYSVNTALPKNMGSKVIRTF